MKNIIIENDGQNIKSTNFWESEYAENGFLFLSWNAGRARILVPKIREEEYLKEMATAEHIIVTRGYWEEQKRDALEILFEDNSDNPFVIYISEQQTDRLIPDDNQGGGFDVAIITKDGEQYRRPGKYRKVAKIPYLKAWENH